MTNTPRTWEAHIRTKYGISNDKDVDGLVADISTIEDEAVRRRDKEIREAIYKMQNDVNDGWEDPRRLGEHKGYSKVLTLLNNN